MVKPPRPDLRIYGALVLAGVLEPEVAQRIVDSYGDPPDYNNPVPMDVESACSVLANRMEEREEEAELATILEMRVGEEVEEELIDPDFDDDDADGAFALWHAYKILMKKAMQN